MAQDHYVAQTFLKHFADTDGRLHAYAKQPANYFRFWPKDVCREWDGDLNPALQGDPELLGVYRNIFEPHWNDAVEELNKRNSSSDVKLMVAICFAHMMVCVPVWRRVSATIYENMRTARLRFKKISNEERGVKDELLAQGVAMLSDGKIRLEVDPNSIKAKLTINLMRYACLAYHSNWVFVENDTEIPFLTSDNPVALRYAEVPGAPLTRFMPITPRLGLLMTFDQKKQRDRVLENEPGNIERLLREKPAGTIRGAKPILTTVRDLNRLIVQCAENLVFSSRKDDGVERLVQKHAKYRIEPESKEWREPDGAFIHGFIIRVRHRTD